MSYPASLARLVLATRPEDLHRDGDQWKCRCPAHRDLKASLAVKVASDGKLLLCCHAGCATSAILTAWGVSWEVLFPDQPAPNGTQAVQASAPRAQNRIGEPEITYDYVDEHGALLYQVCRFAGKEFRQRRPLLDGRWAWNLHRVRRVLWGLPEIVNASPDRVIWLCEGEKDAKRLRDEGLLATTNPGGAQKWRPEYTEALQGRLVAILPDNDEVGREHVAKVRQALEGRAARVTVVELPGLPEHGDVSDWLDQGHTVEELEGLRSENLMSPPSPQYPMSPPSPMSPAEVRQRLLNGITTFRDLQAREFDAMRWAVYQLVGDGCTLLVGSPKIGKSWLVLAVALAVASGDVALGRSTQRAGVLYLALEDSDRRLRERLETLIGSQQAPEGLYYQTSWLPYPGGLELLDDWLGQHPEVGLLIVDTLGAIKGDGPKNGDAYSADYGIAHALSELARRHHVALIVVHHDRKATSDDWLHTVSGTLGLTGAADAILLLRRGRNQADGVLHVTGRDVPESKLALSFNGSSWTLLDGDADAWEMDSKRREVLDVLKQSGPMTARMVAEAVEGSREALKKMLRRMARDGLIKLTDQGWCLPGHVPTSEENVPRDVPTSGGNVPTSGENVPTPGGDVPAPGGDVSGPGGDVPGDAPKGPFELDNGGVGTSGPLPPLNSPGGSKQADLLWPTTKDLGGGGVSGPDVPTPPICPRCGGEGKPAGVSPTTFAAVRKCRACGCMFRDAEVPTNDDDEEPAND